MFYFQTNQLKFTAEFLGRVRLVGSVASLVGVGCYNFCLKVCVLSSCVHSRYRWLPGRHLAVDVFWRSVSSSICAPIELQPRIAMLTHKPAS